MSFLSGFLGNKAADSFVDQAVDKAGELLLCEQLKETFKLFLCEVFALFVLRHFVSSFSQAIIFEFYIIFKTEGHKTIDEI